MEFLCLVNGKIAPISITHVDVLKTSVCLFVGRITGAVVVCATFKFNFFFFFSFHFINVDLNFTVNEFMIF